MREHPINHSHYHEPDSALSGLLEHCCHIFAHRFGGRGRGQEGILSVIAQKPGITQKELAQTLSIQPASVSELLIKLEHKGFILREKDELDRRSIRVQLTEEGQQILQQPKEDPVDPFQALSLEEQVQLQTLLEKLLTDWHTRFPYERNRHGHKHHKHNHL